MNKLELINQLKNDNRISKDEAKAVVDLFLEKISDALANGEGVEIRCLCSFKIKEYKSHSGRNPKTSQKNCHFLKPEWN